MHQHTPAQARRQFILTQAHRLPAFMSAVLIALTAAAATGAQEPATFGFSAAESARERALEQRFDAGLNAVELRAWLQRLAAEPNHVGSPHDKANAEFVRDLFKQWGWDAQIEVFEVLYPTLKQHSLELIAPSRFTATLKEPPVAGMRLRGAPTGCRPTTSTAPTAT
jgi:N-acetylated-alpha-linked acidic dipeptidase